MNFSVRRTVTIDIQTSDLGESIAAKPSDIQAEVLAAIGKAFDTWPATDRQAQLYAIALELDSHTSSAGVNLILDLAETLTRRMNP